MLRKIGGAIIVIIGGASWLPIGREFLKALFWDRVLHMVNPYIEQFRWGYLFDYAPAVFFIAFGLFLLFGPFARSAPMRRRAAAPQAEFEEKLANNPELAKELDTLILEGMRQALKDLDMPVEDSIRPSIQLKFSRWKGFYEFFAGRPFQFYWAKRRLEFINAWAWYFRQRDRLIIPDMSNERNAHNARVAAALVYTVNQGPDEIYHLGYRPDDVRMQIEAAINSAAAEARGNRP